MTKHHPFSRQKVIVTLFLLAVVLADLDPLDLDPPSPNPLADIDPPGPLVDLDPPTELNVLVEIDNALSFSA